MKSSAAKVDVKDAVEFTVELCHVTQGDSSGVQWPIIVYHDSGCIMTEVR